MYGGQLFHDRFINELIIFFEKLVSLPARLRKSDRNREKYKTIRGKKNFSSVDFLNDTHIKYTHTYTHARTPTYAHSHKHIEAKLIDNSD